LKIGCDRPLLEDFKNYLIVLHFSRWFGDQNLIFTEWSGGKNFVKNK
jgi:hypothetical protein